MTNPTEQQFNSATEAAAAWQVFLDESFPRGATFTQVLADGTLNTEGRFNLPVVVVALMRGQWPVLTSFDGDRDVLAYVGSWEEIDRDGHYVARMKLLPVDGSRSGEWELNSWFSDGLAEMMAPEREKLREVLMQQAQFSGPSGELTVTPDAEAPATPSGDPLAPSAPVDEGVELSYVNPHARGSELVAPPGTVPEVVALTRADPKES